MIHVSSPVPPPILTTLAVPSQVVSEEDNITLTCNIQLDPSVDSTVMVNTSWIEPGGAAINVINFTQFGSTYSNILTLHSVVTEESGVYTCAVSVSAAYASSISRTTSVEGNQYKTAMILQLASLPPSLSCHILHTDHLLLQHHLWRDELLPDMCCRGTWEQPRAQCVLDRAHGTCY